MQVAPGIRLFSANEGHEHHVGDEDSSCFYFAPLMLGRFNCEAARFCRIEVTDNDNAELMHRHPGLTMGIITYGYGKLLFEGNEAEGVQLCPGDMFIIEPKTLHLSVAALGTTLIEHLVYIGEKDDRQSIVD